MTRRGSASSKITTQSTHSRAASSSARISLRENGPLVSFDGPHGIIAVEGDDQKVSQVPGGGEISGVPGMEDIETAVGEDDFLPRLSLRVITFFSSLLLGFVFFLNRRS